MPCAVVAWSRRSPADTAIRAVRLWVAALDSPIGEDGQPEQVGDHPLVAPQHAEILQAIQREATYGDRVLHPIWSDYCQAVGTAKVLAEIQALHHTLKEQRADAHSRASGRAGVTGGYVRPERIEYWQPPVAHRTWFVGRADELAELSGTADSYPLHLVHGVGGCGKTALAVEYADRLADRYPDGRVFLDFHSYSPEAHHAPKTAEWALAELLPHCGLKEERTSGMTPAELETAWKQAITGRRIVFVWDNVDDLAQVQPLLTGQPGCITIITSRSELDLGGDSLALGPMAPTDAYELFATIAGEDRCRDHPDLVEEAARLCARMPLHYRDLRCLLGVSSVNIWFSG